MLIAKLRLAVLDALSVTVAVKLNAPAVTGMPVIEPSAESKSPGGAAPDHRYGGVPPEAPSDCPYGVPTVPFGSGEIVVMVSGAVAGSILTTKIRVAESPSRSVTLIVKPKVPAVVGVPVMFPAELSDSPGAKASETSVNV